MVNPVQHILYEHSVTVFFCSESNISARDKCIIMS